MKPSLDSILWYNGILDVTVITWRRRTHWANQNRVVIREIRMNACGMVIFLNSISTTSYPTARNNEWKNVIFFSSIASKNSIKYIFISGERLSHRCESAKSRSNKINEQQQDEIRNQVFRVTDWGNLNLKIKKNLKKRNDQNETNGKGKERYMWDGGGSMRDNIYYEKHFR